MTSAAADRDRRVRALVLDVVKFLAGPGADLHAAEGGGMSADASRSARRTLALSLGTRPLSRRLPADSRRSPRRAIGPAEVIHASGSTWWEVDAEGSLRASVGCAGRRRAPQVGPTRHAAALCGPAVCRVPAAYARPTPAAGGHRAERCLRASSWQRVRVAASPLERLVPCVGCRHGSARRRAGTGRVRARTDVPAAASAAGRRHTAGPPSRNTVTCLIGCDQS